MTVMDCFGRFRDPVTRGPLALATDGCSLVGADGAAYPIVAGIPRFVTSEDYTANFGLEWTIHRRTQLDSATGRDFSRQRLERCLGTRVEQLAGQAVLEAGCGAGRFTEVLVGAGARVHAFDMSRAVEANKANIGDTGQYCIAQASVYEMPFEPASFDCVVALGMIQHTPDPERAMAALYDMVRPGGRLVLDHYRWTLKYFLRVMPWVRLLLKNVDGPKAKAWCDRMTRICFPLHWAVRRRPLAARVIRVVSPCAMPDSSSLPMLDALGRENSFDWLALDTFDALTDRYKHLRTPGEIHRTLAGLGAVDISIAIGGNGVEASCTKPAGRGSGPS